MKLSAPGGGTFGIEGSTGGWAAWLHFDPGMWGVSWHAGGCCRVWLEFGPLEFYVAGTF